MAYNPVTVEHLHGKMHADHVFTAVDELRQEQEEAAEEVRRKAVDRKLQEAARRAQEDQDKELDAARKEAEAASAPAPATGPASGTSASPDNSSGAQAKARAGRKKKKPKEDIFHDFGKEHDDAPIQEIKVNGMVVHRLNYKRYWQSDRDLKRWGESLSHNIRYEKLLLEVRERWHEDLLGDRLELKCNHNALQRSRTEERLKPAPSASVTLQLRELQKQVAPKDNKKKKGFAAFGGFGSKTDLGVFKGLGSGEEPQGPQGSEEPMAETFGLLRGEAAEDLLVSPTARSDTGASALDLDSPRRRRPSHGSVDDQELATSASAPALASRVGKKKASGETGAAEVKFPAEMPSTMSLLLFRNADRLHTGETLFVKRWPPAGGLKELLQLAGQACKPVIAPTRALYDTELKPIRALEEIVPGGIYLLKGLEGFDPPKLFFNHQSQSEVPSLRALNKAKQTAAGERDVLDQFSQVPSAASTMSRISLYGERQPTMDSPPWPSRGRLQLPPKPRKWHVDEFLGMKLSWGGQGLPHQHHHYEDWTPVLKSKFSNHIDRHGTSSYASTC